MVFEPQQLPRGPDRRVEVAGGVGRAGDLSLGAAHQRYRHHHLAGADVAVGGAQHEHDDRRHHAHGEHQPADRLPGRAHERGPDGPAADTLGERRVARRKGIGDPVGAQLARLAGAGGEAEQLVEEAAIRGERVVGALLYGAGTAVRQRGRDREQRHDEHRRVDRREQHDDADGACRLPGQADQLARRAGERAAVLGQLLDPRQQLMALEVLERRQGRRQARDPHAEREARLVGQERPLGARDEREQPAQREQPRDEHRADHDLVGVVRDGAVDHHAIADACR